MTQDHQSPGACPEAAAPVEQAAPEFPAGAIVNGRTLLDRLEQTYSFDCEAGPLRLCSEWHELRRSFEHLAEHAAQQAAQPVAQEPVACLIRSRSCTDARLCHNKRPSFGEWGDWQPATLAHGLAVTNPSRNDPKVWDMLPLYTAAPAPVALTPLTYDQIVDALVDDAGLNLAFRSYEEDMKFARAIERAHGIGIKEGGNG